ncbi:MAG: hypothetical protein ACRER2_03815 [Methylococcales bacterium]
MLGNFAALDDVTDLATDLSSTQRCLGAPLNLFDCRFSKAFEGASKSTCRLRWRSSASIGLKQTIKRSAGKSGE